MWLIVVLSDMNLKFNLYQEMYIYVQRMRQLVIECVRAGKERRIAIIELSV